MQKFKNSILLLMQLFIIKSYAQNFTISGYVNDEKDGESLIGVTASFPSIKKGTVSNGYGYYACTLPSGTYEIVFNYLGYQAQKHTIILDKNITLNIKLSETTNQLGEVVIKAGDSKGKQQVQSTEMGKLNIPIELIRKVPTLFGESDLIKVLQLMPGVKRGTEGTTGMYVRGGGNDENLILLDEAPVYNTGHLLGFFSVFNSNSIKDVSLFKGAFPAQYGGRLSSILDIKMREGNDKKFAVQGMVGVIASNLTIEGPIIKNKCSFIISGRRTYLDEVIKVLSGKNLLPYYFYDLNAKVNYKLNERDRIYLSSYFGRDVLKASSDAADSLNAGINSFVGNFTITARWNHVYRNNKLFHNISIIQSNFKYDVSGKVLDNSVLVTSKIQDIGAKADYEYRPTVKQDIKFGMVFINHLFRPNVVSTQGDITKFLASREGAKIYNQEVSLYASNDYDVNSRMKINYGARLSSTFVTNTLYAGLEPRLAAKYAINENSSIKMGYARMKQYLHLVSSAAIALPTDLWYPVTKNVKPGRSDQVSAGYYQYLQKPKINITAEVYYKWLNHLIEYREGANLILNDNYESELVAGKGTSYGFELLVQKNEGRFSGWISYTLAWSNRTFPDLNNGKTYYSKFDRRHDIAVVGNYTITKRWSISGAWVFSTGAPFTARVAQYLMPNPTFTGIDVLPVYTSKNQIRLHASHRLDIDITYKSRINSKYKGEWHFGAYNVYNRTQPAFINIKLNTDSIGYHYEERGIFGIIYSVAYNFQF
jgi:hypothetical protein